MTWCHQNIEHSVFSRNPLISAIVELRYHPILRISSGTGIPEFQERIRADFPSFSEFKKQVVKLEKNVVEINEEKQYRFETEDRGLFLTLSPSSIHLDNKRHYSHTDTIRAMGSGIGALAEVYSPIKLTRLGVRYINLIDIKKISEDLGKNVEWPELIREDFLKFPNNLADLNSTAYWVEVDSPVETDGSMTLRYGFRREENLASATKFHFDVDRYLEGSLEVESLSGLIEQFSHDIYSIYMSMIGPELLNWMRLENN